MTPKAKTRNSANPAAKKSRKKLTNKTPIKSMITATRVMPTRKSAAKPHSTLTDIFIADIFN